MVNLSLVTLDYVLRGGVPDADRYIQRYEAERGYPSVYGLSSIFHPGYSLDQLAQTAAFLYGQIHYATVGELVVALALLGYEPILVHTPSAANPDHHTLGIAHTGVTGVTLQALPRDAALTLVTIFHRAPNPYQRRP